jgi:spore coat protein A
LSENNRTTERPSNRTALGRESSLGGTKRRVLLISSALLVALIFLVPLAQPALATSGTGSSPQSSGGGMQMTGSISGPNVPPLLDPMCIPKWKNQITGPPPVYVPTVVKDASGNVIAYNYTVNMSAFDQQILPPGMPKTHVWGYGGEAKDPLTGQPLGFVRNSPAPSFEAVRGIPINVKWVNDINESQMFAVDPTLHWADPNNMMLMDKLNLNAPPFPPGFAKAQKPVPLVPHGHGLEVQSTSDGNPDAWWTADGQHGPAYSTYEPTDPNAAIFHYPMEQPATTSWYHDHALGMTRLNVMSGLAGFWLIRDPNDNIAPLLPSGKYEVPIAIQDRIFKADGNMYFPSDGINPCIHPYWNPEFFGNVIMVNGLVWPNMNVDQGQYRFRVLDGSNARFYNLSFSNGMPFTVIGTEGGYIREATTMTKLLIAPGERYDILVDFSNIAPGTQIIMKNDAAAPYPSGDPANLNPQTVGQIMQFTVTDKKGHEPAKLPKILNPTLDCGFPSLSNPTKTRQLTLTEVQGPNGPQMVLLDGQRWSAPISEKPQLGATEEWVIVDATADTHPIHLHLVQFQVVSRQPYDQAKYYADWIKLNGQPPLDHPTKNLDLDKYLLGKPRGPDANEKGWKDTVKMNTGEVTKILVRFSPIDGSPNYPFDATKGPGYVWHCHIIDHEDNEMMRPYLVVPATKAQ